MSERELFTRDRETFWLGFQIGAIIGMVFGVVVSGLAMMVAP